MIQHWVSDENMIIGVYTDTDAGIMLAKHQAQQVANAFPDSRIFLHSGSFADNAKPIEVGMSTSVKGATEIPSSGKSTSQHRDDMAQCPACKR